MPILKIPIKYKEFLEEHDAFNRFVKNYQLTLCGLSSIQIERKIKGSNSELNFELFLKTSFVWSDSDEGHRYWLAILDDYNTKNKKYENTISV